MTELKGEIDSSIIIVVDFDNVLSHDMNQYVESLKEYTRELPKLIHEFSNFQDTSSTHINQIYFYSPAMN